MPLVHRPLLTRVHTIESSSSSAMAGAQESAAKKVEGGKIKFILLKKPGEAFICNQYDTAALNAVLATPSQTHA